MSDRLTVFMTTVLMLCTFLLSACGGQTHADSQQRSPALISPTLSLKQKAHSLTLRFCEELKDAFISKGFNDNIHTLKSTGDGRDYDGIKWSGTIGDNYIFGESGGGIDLANVVVEVLPTDE